MREIDHHYNNLPLVNLHPGELFVPQKPTIITTILGSCVAVCLYCPLLKMGAMCHGVMPFRPKGAVDSFRFVDSSISYMVDALARQHGLVCSSLEAKLFGGADVLDLKLEVERGMPAIGAQNIDAARELLDQYGVPIIAEKVGGDSGYKLVFYSHTGDVFLKRISRIKTRKNVAGGVDC